MKGTKKVIDLLNKQLTLELTAMDQYLAHAEMYKDWGIKGLQEKLSHEYEEEQQHAKRLMERILFLEGTPDTASRGEVNVGDNVQQMLENDLAGERVVADSLRQIISICEQERDYVSRDMLEELLDETETDHIYWLEQHLGIIEKIGLPNYLQSQLQGSPI